MDSFIDKFAQRKNAQEMIRANAMAEAEERKKMEIRLSEYEQAIQEMRRCSLLNVENAEKVKEMLSAGLTKIEEVQKRDDGGADKAAEEVKALLGKLTEQMEKFAEEQQSRTTKLIEEQQSRMAGFLEQQTAQTKKIEELLHESDEFGHKEAVKVYRNVQAVIEGALPKQTEEIMAAIKSAEGKKKIPAGMVLLGVLTFAAAAANVVIEVLRILGYL